MMLDIKTIIICIAFCNIVCGVLAIGYNAKIRSKRINLYIIAKALQVIGFFLIGMVGILPRIITILLGNMTLIWGASIESVVLLKIIKKWTPIRKKNYIVITFLFTFLLCLTYIFNLSQSFRIAEISFFTALLAFYPAIQLLSKMDRTPLRIITSFLYIIAIFAHLTRAFDAIFSKGNYSIYMISPVQSTAFISILIMTVGGNLGIILISKEEIDKSLIQSATYDFLTGILNRNSFISKFEEKLKLMKRKNQTGAFLMIDLDLFKKVNDNYGHIQGDKSLVMFVKTIKENLDNSSLFGRFGGEEFVIFLENIGEEEAYQKAELLRKTIENRFDLIKCTVSIGFTFINEEEQLDFILKRADEALYEAKREGRNRVNKYTVAPNKFL